MQRNYCVQLKILLLALICLLTACGSPSISENFPHPNSTSDAQSTPPSQLSTSCPAPGTARAGQMPPMTTSGRDPNLVYAYNDGDSGNLVRYDTVTHQKTWILPFHMINSVQQAQVSLDGQWVLMIVVPNSQVDTVHSAMIQLVRIDGRYLQTLYCFPHINYTMQAQAGKSFHLPITMAWNTDWLLFSVDMNNNESDIFLLDVREGNVRTVLHSINQDYRYQVLTWTSTQAYIERLGRVPGLLPESIFLWVFTKYPTNTDPSNSDEWGLVTTQATRNTTLSIALDHTGSLIYAASCTQSRNPLISTIQSGPAAGGAPLEQLNSVSSFCYVGMSVMTNDQLLLLVEPPASHGRPSSPEIWTISTDGTHRKVISSLPSGLHYTFNDSSQFPWSNVSPDGSLYVVQSLPANDGTQNILYGALAPNKGPTLVEQDVFQAELVGWVTM